MAEAILSPHLHVVRRKIARSRGIRFYFSGVPCLNGHLNLRLTSTGHCMQCERDRYHARSGDEIFRAKRKAAAARRNSTPEGKEKLREYYLRPENNVRIKAYKRRPEVRAKRIAYEHSARGRAIAYACAKRRRATPQGNAKEAARLMLRRALDVIGGKKVGRTVEMLGYTPQDLAAHLEGLFLPRMGWHNRSKWHIDHIRPLSSFDLTDSAQFLAANSLHNLRPIWAKINQKKSDKWDGQLTLPV